MRLILCAFVVMTWTTALFFGPQAPTLPGPLTPIPATFEILPSTEAVAPSVDFEGLRSQARDALDRLRQAQAARQVAMASAGSL